MTARVTKVYFHNRASIIGQVKGIASLCFGIGLSGNECLCVFEAARSAYTFDCGHTLVTQGVEILFIPLVK